MSKSHPAPPVPTKVSLPESFVPCTECGKHYIVRGQKVKPQVCQLYAERDALPGV